MTFLPAWKAYDGTVSTRLLSGRRGSGRVVVLCCSEGATRRPDVPRLAVTLCRAWAEETSRVVLVDADLERPSLHDLLGVPNGVGLSDVLFDRTPIEVVTRATGPPTRPVIPSGPARAADLGDPVRDALADLCRAFLASADTLVTFVPDNTKLASWLVDLSTDIVLIQEESEPPPQLLDPDEHRVRAVIGPVFED